MKIGIVMPVFLRNQLQFDFMCRATTSMRSKVHQLVFIPVENHIELVFKSQNYPDVTYPIEKHPIVGRQPQSVAKAWNDGIREAKSLGCELVLVLNQDIVLRYDSIDQLVTFSQTTGPEVVMWTMGQYNMLAMLDTVALQPNSHEHPNFSAFMVRSNFLEEMGEFDENFMPAYMEDNDMHARIALSGKKALVYSGALFFHFGSRTINTDPTLGSEVGNRFGRNGRYYEQKWGAGTIPEVDQMRERYYKHPYNEEDKPLSYWRK